MHNDQPKPNLTLWQTQISLSQQKSEQQFGYQKTAS